MATTATLEQDKTTIINPELPAEPTLEEIAVFQVAATITAAGGDTGFDQLELFLFQKAPDVSEGVPAPEADDTFVYLCAVGDRLTYPTDRTLIEGGQHYRKAAATQYFSTIEEAIAFRDANNRRIQNLVTDWDAVVEEDWGGTTTTDVEAI